MESLSLYETLQYGRYIDEAFDLLYKTLIKDNSEEVENEIKEEKTIKTEDQSNNQNEHNIVDKKEKKSSPKSSKSTLFQGLLINEIREVYNYYNYRHISNTNIYKEIHPYIYNQTKNQFVKKKIYISRKHRRSIPNNIDKDRKHKFQMNMNNPYNNLSKSTDILSITTDLFDFEDSENSQKKSNKIFLNRNKYMYKYNNRLSLKRRNGNKKKTQKVDQNTIEIHDPIKNSNSKHFLRKRPSKPINYSDALSNTTDLERAKNEKSLLLSKRTKRLHTNSYINNKKKSNNHNLGTSFISPPTRSILPPVIQSNVPLSFNQNPIYNYTPSNNDLIRSNDMAYNNLLRLFSFDSLIQH